MIPAIFIIHSSDIVRKGLTTIIKNQFQAEITEYSDIGFLSVEVLGGARETVFFIEDKFIQTTQFTGVFSEKDVLSRVVKIRAEDNNNHHCSEDTMFCISIYSNAAFTLNLLKKLLSSTVEKSGEHEGEELTQREQDVLKLVALGFPNKLIAEKLFISIHTVISHRKNITEKLGIKSISGLTVYAILNRLIDTSDIRPEDLL